MANSSSKSIPGNWVLPTVLLTGIGVGLGFFINQGGMDAPVQDTIRNLSIGLVWAFIILQWVDIIGQAVALLSDPVSSDLNLSDKVAVAEKAAGMKRTPDFLNRSANLLQAWGEALNPQALIDLAAFQSSRARKPILTGTVFGFLVLYAVGLSSASPVIIWGGGVLLGLTLLAKVGLLSRIDAYIEGRILSRLPGDLPNAGMTVSALADAIGQSIDQSFERYIPKPEALASVLSGSVDQASKAISSQGDSIAKALEGAQSGIVSSFEGSGKELAAALTAAQSGITASFSSSGKDMAEQLSAAQSGITESLSSSGKDMAEQLSTAQSGFQSSLSGASKETVDKLAAVQSALQSGLSGAGKEAVDQLTASLSSHSDRLEATSQSLVSQIEKLTEVEKNIENLLNVQKSVEDALQGVSASKQFQDTLSALSTHLADSDKLLKEASKPRMITLVEED